MKSKKWIIITAVSFVLIVASLVLLFVWVLPSMSKNKALKALEEGNAEDAKTLFADMTPEKREDLKEDVKDIVVYTANQYIDGKKSYEDMFKVMATIEDISGYGGLSADAFLKINVPKMVETYNAALKVYGEDGNNDQFKKKSDEFDWYRNVQLEDTISLRYSWDSEQKDTYEETYEKALDAELKAKYDDYSADKLSYEEMKAACSVANSFWYSDYSYDVANELYYDDYFRGRLEDYQKEYDNKEYFNVLDNVDYITKNYKDEPAWSRWESKFEELSKKASEDAKTYYVQQAVDYVNAGDTWEAEYLRDKLVERFGDAVDVAPIEAAIQENSHTEWQKAYVNFMYDWKNNLVNDMAIAAGNGSMTANLYDADAVTIDDLDPKYITLYDIDKNGTPEMFLRGTEYVAVYTYKNNMVVYTGYLAPMGLGGTGEMIVGAQQTVDGTLITAEALVKFDAEYTQWDLADVVAYANIDGQYAYVIYDDDGSAKQVDEDTFKEHQAGIEGRMSGSLAIGVEMDKFEDYIYSFSN